MLVIKGQRRTESKKVLKTTSWSALARQGFQRKKTFAKKYSETLNNEYIERIHQMSFSLLSDNGMLQIFSFLIK